MKNKKVIMLMAALTVAAAAQACGSETVISDVTETVETNDRNAVLAGNSETADLMKTYGNYVIFNEAQGEAVDIPLGEFAMLDGEYTLTKDVPLYYTGGKQAGFVKAGTTISIMDGDDEWLRFINTEKNDSLTVDFLLVKAEDLRTATDDVVLTAKDFEEPETEAEQVASKPQEVKPSIQESASNVETPKAETTPVADDPVADAPPEETPAAEENTKYTPDEAIAVWSGILNANGMTYDPSIKDFASWGTGWIDLEKGMPEQIAQQDLLGYAYGDGVGNSSTRYYFEITGSDDDRVYLTSWSCD